MRLSISTENGVTIPLPRTTVRRIVSHALSAEGLRVADPWELSILFTGADDIRAWNLRWRGIDRATDVLSFPAAEGEGASYAPFLLGDLIIAPAVVAAHAARYRVAPEQETAFVIVHGVLHLLGHDHLSRSQRDHMRERERAIMQGLGYHHAS
ncbi:MAG TPA: rRNA maturation RNase YbeY [bacterium]|nr:rRNA maturation RNase YbeY [bacterium]